MRFFRYLIEHYVGTLLLIGLALLLGLLGLFQLPVSFYPDFTVPVAIVITPYPGAGPESVEYAVTKPLEQSLATLSGIDLIESTSREGFSQLVVSFSYGADTEQKKREIQEKIDLAKPLLPRDAGLPVISTINQLLPPPVQLAVSSERLSLSELTMLVDDRIAPDLARLPGVAAAQVAGGSRQVVAVEAFPQRLRQSNIGLEQLAAAISSGNANFPLGDLKAGSNLFTLRLEGEYRSVEDIGNQLVAYRSGAGIRVRDLARVAIRENSRESLARINSKESVGILVRQPSGGNALQVSDGVRRWLDKNRGQLPGDLKIEVVRDESENIRRALAEVLLSGLLGGLLAVLVIFMFLGTLANTLVIVMAIPVALTVTFSLMRIFGLSLNTVSIGGLSLAVGLIVDAAVVVMENCYRHIREGDLPGTRLEVIARAVAEVGLPVSAATLTTVVVFLPLAFTAGFAKVLLGELALTVVFALGLSMVVSLTLVPVLSYFLMGSDRPGSKINGWFLLLLDKTKRRYLGLLGWSLDHPGLVAAFFLLMLLAGMLLSRVVDYGLLAKTDQGEFQITVSYQPGTSLEHTEERLQELETKLGKIPGVARVFSLVGRDPFFGTPQQNFATVNVFTDRRKPVFTAMDSARSHLEQMAGADYTIRVIDATSGAVREDIDILIFGEDLDSLEAVGRALIDQLSKRPENINLNSSLSQGLPTYRFVPDRRNLSAVGLTAQSLGQVIRAGKSGQVISLLQRGGRDVEIRLALEGSESLGLRSLQNMPIATPVGGILPLKALGTFKEGRAPLQIGRINQGRVANITGSFSPMTKARQARTKLKEAMSSINLPAGYRLELRGANRAIVESFKTLGIALLVAVLLVYIVMGVQFNSLSLPFVIILSVPFSLPGFFAALFITGDQLNLSSFLAGIILSGIVVNNSILLLDFTVNMRRGSGNIKQALVRAAEIRFRPIMMTTMTTVLGALFLAINPGGGGQALQSLARAFIGGMSYSLLVSLILVPVVYTLADSLLCRFSRSCMPASILDGEKRVGA